MRWWKRREKRQPIDYSALSYPPTATGDDARDEGVLLAEYSARMRVKNSILVEVLAGRGWYDEKAFAAETADALRALATEMDTAAERMTEEVADAAASGGRAIDMHDYRNADVPNLELRAETYIAVAEELRRRADDDEYVAELLRTARDDAWHEVSYVIGERLDTQRIPSAVDDEYKRGRENRLRLLKNVDLARLQLDKIDY